MSEAVETPRPPEEVLDDDRIEYQAMTDLSDDEYHRLAEDIRERGVLQPIITDETGTILDGHHRAALAEQLDLDKSRQPAYVVLGDLDGDDEKLARAIKQNVLGRDTGDAVKTHAVKQYIETAWDRTDDGDLIKFEDEGEVSEKLGVSSGLVSEVINNFNGEKIYHDRVTARQYYEENPDASYREVARQVDSSQPTVTEWLKEDFDEGDDDDEEDDDTSLAAFTRDGSGAKKAQETFQKTDDDTTNEEVRETARENSQRLGKSETSPTTAAKNIEKAEAEKQVEEQRTVDAHESPTPTIAEMDAVEWLQTIDQGDVLLTDPPYTTDVQNVTEFARSWVPKALDSVADDGYAYIFVGSYADELVAYLQVLSKTNFYVQPLVWNYRNTLGRSPTDRYKRDWQAVLYCRGPDAGDLNAPKTAELRSVQEVNAPGMPGDDTERHHKWQKPSELVEQYIRHSTEEGDLVIDPFAGSGEILLTAVSVGREAAGCDNDPDAIATAVNRGCITNE